MRRHFSSAPHVAGIVPGLWNKVVKRSNRVSAQKAQVLGGRWEVEEGGDICMYLWLIHVDVWQKPTQYYKAIILQLKKEKRAHNQWVPPRGKRGLPQNRKNMLLMLLKVSGFGLPVSRGEPKTTAETTVCTWFSSQHHSATPGSSRTTQTAETPSPRVNKHTLGVYLKFSLLLITTALCIRVQAEKQNR